MTIQHANPESKLGRKGLKDAIEKRMADEKAAAEKRKADEKADSLSVGARKFRKVLSREALVLDERIEVRQEFNVTDLNEAVICRVAVAIRVYRDPDDDSKIVRAYSLFGEERKITRDGETITVLKLYSNRVKGKLKKSLRSDICNIVNTLNGVEFEQFVAGNQQAIRQAIVKKKIVMVC